MIRDAYGRAAQSPVNVWVVNSYSCGNGDISVGKKDCAGFVLTSNDSEM